MLLQYHGDGWGGVEGRVPLAAAFGVGDERLLELIGETEAGHHQPARLVAEDAVHGMKANRPKHDLSVNLLQPVGELAGFSPTGFHEQVENLEQRGEAFGFGVVGTVENLAVVGESALNEFHNLGDGE